MKNIHAIGIILITFFVQIILMPAIARSENVGISPQLLEQMRSAARYTGPEKAIYNSLINNEIKKLALD